MGCNILDMLFHLDPSLLEVLFVYTIKMSRKGIFKLFTHILSLQLVTGLLDSNKGNAKGHVLVWGLWVGLVEDPDRDFCPHFSLKIPGRIGSICFFTLSLWLVWCNPGANTSCLVWCRQGKKGSTSWVGREGLIWSPQQVVHNYFRQTEPPDTLVRSEFASNCPRASTIHSPNHFLTASQGFGARGALRAEGSSLLRKSMWGER